VIAQDTGHLLYRIQIPVTPATVYDALAVAEGQNILAVITASGVSFVDLSSLPIDTEYKHKFVNTEYKTGTQGVDSTCCRATAAS
jgi:hypothetical protein